MTIKKLFRSSLVLVSAHMPFACVAWDAPVPLPDYTDTTCCGPAGGSSSTSPEPGETTTVVIPQDPPASFAGAGTGGAGGAGGAHTGFVSAGAPSDAGNGLAWDASDTVYQTDAGADDDALRDAGTLP